MTPASSSHPSQSAATGDSEDDHMGLHNRTLLQKLLRRFDRLEAKLEANIGTDADLLKLRRSLNRRVATASRNIAQGVRDIEILQDMVSEQAEEIKSLQGSLFEAFGQLRTLAEGIRGDVRLCRQFLGSDFSGQTGSGFPKFPDLPLKVQRIIWDFATPGNILELREVKCEKAGHRKDQYRFFGRRLPPVTASVCRLSRKVACFTGKLVSLENFRILSTDHSGGPSAYSSKTQWAWFDSARDSLYLVTQCWDLHCKTDLLQHVRHVVLPQRLCEVQIFQLLDTDTCPQLASIQLASASLKWPAQHDLEFEARLWGEGPDHVLIPMKGDASEDAKRVYSGLKKRLGPDFSAQARVLLDQLFGGDTVFCLTRRGLLEDYPKTFAEKWGYMGDIDTREAKPRLTQLESMVEKNMLRCVWMLSRVPIYENFYAGPT
ncbi:hypothetical protein NUW58_g5363 [Xylaria curta]|uniref:Uncharacterized protein n=1 Tax=Xylaria curta TaxID=42375 RepID=A0ACC1P451_9PEZI|nr:hypothetical protein NUW58_g5363 [Xylaria curta]